MHLTSALNSRQNNVIDIAESRMSDLSSLSDDELVALMKENNSNAFNIIVKRHSKRLFYVALSMIKNEETSWDILQESFIKIFKKIKKFKGQSSLFTWMARIVVNTSIDHIRKQKRQKDVNRKPIEELDETKVINYTQMPESPEGEFFKKYEKAEVMKAINMLEGEKKLLLHLKYFEELSIKDIATVLEQKEGNIKSKLFYARKELKHHIEHLM